MTIPNLTDDTRARRIVILEGPDGSGKTTLAKELERRGWRYYHEGLPTREDMLQEYAEKFLNLVQASTRSLVMDRAHIGEMIYGNIIRGHNRIGGETGLTLLNRLYVASGARIVFCLPPIATAIDNWTWRSFMKGEYVQECENMKAVYGAYFALYSKWLKTDVLDAHLMRYDYTKDREMQIIDNLEANLLKIPLPAIGSPYAKYLFIGDVANHEYLDLPFFSVKNSSGYLFDRIVEAGLRENDIAFVNAKSIDGSFINLERIVTRGLPFLKRVIALGTVASSCYRRSGLKLPVFNVPHPAYWMRFKTRHSDAYTEALRNACKAT